MTTAVQPNDNNKMPPGIPFIISNEFAERFCFYGINAILSIYMVQHLQFGEAQATTWQSLFKSGAYFFPLLGAIVSDVFWGKFRTIIIFSMAYCAGCAALALSTGPVGLGVGLFLIAFGTGGIKPCVSTNVGDQFTAKNQHLIERAFSWFYLSINAGSLISILLCPWLLDTSGPRWAFGVPGIAMFFATIVFWLGRRKFAVVPPAMTRNVGRGLALFAAGFVPVLAISVLVFVKLGALPALGTLIGLLCLLIFVCLKSPLRNHLPAELVGWLEPAFTGDGLRLVGRLAVIYLFIAVFWSLWDQSNGTTWTLQAQSSLMDKDLGFGITLLPAQIQFVNALFILMMVPVFSYGIYPALGRFFAVTPLRKIGIGFFVTASSFVLVAWIENRIQSGIVTSLWWQIAAYAILTAGEVLVSITALEYSYKQAPLRMKSFIMALYLLSVSLGNFLTAGVADSMIKPIDGVQIATGPRTTLVVPAELGFVSGQKIDFGGDTGVSVLLADGKTQPLAGTYIVDEVADGRAVLLDVIARAPVATQGEFKAEAEVSTYRLVGPQFFMFFCYLMLGTGVLWIVVASMVKEQTFVRDDNPVPPAAGKSPPA